MLNQAFTEKAVKHATNFMTSHIERWIDLLIHDIEAGRDHDWSKPRNMSEWSDWIVFDILGYLCFGRSLNIKEPGPNPIREIPHLVIRHVRFFYPVGMPINVLSSADLV
jgi:hypothetical protein